MTNILDQVAKSPFRAPYGHVIPQTSAELFALRLAAKLGDGPAAQHYLQLAEQHSEGQLLAAYRRALVAGGPASLDRRFHVELNKLDGHDGDYIHHSRLCAIRIERRAIAVAILLGDHLEFVDARQLSSSPDKATATAAGFIAKIAATFSFASAALEEIPAGAEIQRASLQRTVTDALGEAAVGLWTGPKAEILAAFGYPAVRERKQVREIISGIYPVLEQEPGRPWTQDAAALGLYVQAERLFNQ